MLKGIDISEHQGKNFKIADHSPEFVIIRGGFSETVDKCAYEFVAQAEKLGIPWGIYWYSYALTIKDATAEAGACIKFLNGKVPPLGVWFDMEDADNYKMHHGFPSADTITLMCREGARSILRRLRLAVMVRHENSCRRAAAMGGRVGLE